MEKEKIERINALFAKQNSPEGLTEEEKAEQKTLREEYIAEYRRALRGEMKSATEAKNSQTFKS